MFKEFAAGCLILLILFFIFKQIKKKYPPFFQKLVWTVLVFCILGNVIYNCIVMFPDYYMETVGGKWRFGTFSGNLFAYNEGWDFQDEILQPIMKNRTILVDQNAPFYLPYFSLLAKEAMPIAVSNERRAKIINKANEFDFQYPFETFRIMDYVKEEATLPDELKAKMDEEEMPLVHIHMASIEKDDVLVCVVADDYSLYIFGESYE